MESKGWNGVYNMKMKTSPNDVSNQEILQELKKLSSDVSDIKGSQQVLIESVQELSSDTDARFRLMDNRLTRVESRMSLMVTKDYLDDKLADQYSKIIQHTDKRIEEALN